MVAIGSGKKSVQRNIASTWRKSYAQLEMDVHSRTAGFGQRCRAATDGVTTFDATGRCRSHAGGTSGSRVTTAST
jgi:hypothetical protein